MLCFTKINPCPPPSLSICCCWGQPFHLSPYRHFLISCSSLKGIIRSKILWVGGYKERREFLIEWQTDAFLAGNLSNRKTYSHRLGTIDNVLQYLFWCNFLWLSIIEWNHGPRLNSEVLIIGKFIHYRKVRTKIGWFSPHLKHKY